MESAVALIHGVRVAAARLCAHPSELELSLDDSVVLTVAPGDDPDMEDWFLYLDNGLVVIAGPAESVQIARSDEPAP